MNSPQDQVPPLSGITAHVKRRQWGLYFLAMLSLGLAQFWDARLFTWYNDDLDFLDHIAKLEDNIAFLFSSEHISSGRPTTTLFLMLVRAFWGDDQVPYHLALIFLHILTAWILAWSLAQVGFRPILSMLTGLIFLFNVTHYTVPYWLSCFGYIGCMCLGCLGMVHYVRFARNPNLGNFALACVFFLVAAATHATALVFVVLAAYFAFRRGATLRIIAWSCLPLIVICVGMMAAFILSYPDHAQNKNVAEITNFLHVAQFTADYLGRTYLSPHWMTRAFIEGPNTLDAVVGALLTAAAVVLLVYRRCTPADAIVWSLIALPIFGGSTLSEYRPRYFYYSSVGPSLMISWLLLEAGDRLSRASYIRLRWVISGVGLAAILTVSHIHLNITESMHWAGTGRSLVAHGKTKEGLRLMRDGIMAAPEYLSRLYYIRYGMNAWFVGTNPTSILEIGRDVYPGDIEIALLHEVNDYITTRRPLTSNFVYRVGDADARTIGSVSAALNNAGSYHYLRREYKRAERLLASAIQIKPDYHRATATYANCLAHQGRLEDAMIAFDRFYQIDEGGLYKNAIPGLKIVVEAEPRNLRARHYLARAYMSVGYFLDAVNQIEAGLATDPANALLRQDYTEIARIHRERGKIETADAILQRILQIEQ